MIKNQSNIKIDGSDNRPILIDITYKENKKCKKVVVFSHGFKGFKDWGAFNQIAKTFAQNDFIFVKFNFSHNGTTAADTMNFVDLEAFGNNNFCKELDDLDFVLDWVEENFINVEIDLLGHSRGGGISMLKTAEENRISKVVSWASPSDFTNRIPEERIAIWKEKGVAFIYNGRTKQNMPLYFQFYESSKVNKNRIDITINEPINISILKPFIEALIKFAGLNKSGISMTCSFKRIGSRLSRAVSICFVSL